MVQSTQVESVLPVIRTMSASLTPGDARVAAAILNRPTDVIHMSVSELAERAGTAASTVVRACKSLGFKGFQDLKIRIAQEVGAGGPPVSVGDQSTPGDGRPALIVRRVMDSAARALSEAPVTIDENEFERAVAAIAAAGRVLVAGVGTSWAPAQDAGYRFMMIGLQVQAPVDVRGQLLAARLLNKGDVLVVMSHTGASAETLEAAEAAQVAGSTVVAITSFARSALASHSNVVLVAGGHDLGFRLEAMLSRLTHLAVVDALYLAVAERLAEVAKPALDASAAITASHTI